MPSRISIKYCARTGRGKRVRSDTMQRAAFSRCVPSPGAEIALNAFLRRRRYGKVTSRIPGWTRWPSAQLAISLCGMRRSLREAAVMRSAVALPYAVSNSDLRKFLDTSVPSISSHGSPAGTIYRAGKAGAQAMAQSERIKASSAANRFQAVSHASMMSPRLGNTELASQWLRR